MSSMLCTANTKETAQITEYTFHSFTQVQDPGSVVEANAANGRDGKRRGVVYHYFPLKSV